RNEREMVALSRLEVVEVVPGRDLDDAGPEGGIDEDVVADDRDPTPDERQRDLLADEVAVARILRMDGDGRVPQHRLRPSGRDDQAPAPVRERIGDLPQGPADTLFDLDLQVRQRRAARGTPVDQVLAAVDESVLVERDEHLADRPRESLVEGEPRPRE